MPFPFVDYFGTKGLFVQFKPNALQHNDALLNCYSLFMESGRFVVFVKYFSVGFFNPNY